MDETISAFSLAPVHASCSIAITVALLAVTAAVDLHRRARARMRA